MFCSEHCCNSHLQLCLAGAPWPLGLLTVEKQQGHEFSFLHLHGNRLRLRIFSCNLHPSSGEIFNYSSRRSEVNRLGSFYLVKTGKISRTTMIFLLNPSVIIHDCSFHKVIWILPFEWLRWFSIVVALCLSGSVLVLTFWPAVRDDHPKVMVAVLSTIVALNILLAVGCKVSELFVSKIITRLHYTHHRLLRNKTQSFMWNGIKLCCPSLLISTFPFYYTWWRKDFDTVSLVSSCIALT